MQATGNASLPSGVDAQNRTITIGRPLTVPLALLMTSSPPPRVVAPALHLGKSLVVLLAAAVPVKLDADHAVAPLGSCGFSENRVPESQSPFWFMSGR